MRFLGCASTHCFATHLATCCRGLGAKSAVLGGDVRGSNPRAERRAGYVEDEAFIGAGDDDSGLLEKLETETIVQSVKNGK